MCYIYHESGGQLAVDINLIGELDKSPYLEIHNFLLHSFYI